MSQELIQRADQLIKEGKAGAALELLLDEHDSSSANTQINKTISRLYLYLEQRGLADKYLKRVVEIKT